MESVGEPLISAVAIARNEERTIGSCISATRRGLSSVGGGEVLLVDSASSDRTVERALREGCRVFRIRKASRICPAAARWIGASLTRSRYLLFLDGDCELEEGFLPEAVAAMEADPTLGVVAGQRKDYYLTQEGSVPASVEYYQDRRSANDRRHAYGGCALYRRTALEAAGSFNPYLRAKEEEELGYRILSAGYRITVLMVPMIRHTTVPRESARRLLRSLNHGFFLGRGQAARVLLSAGQARAAFHGLDRVLMVLGHLLLGVVAVGLWVRGIEWAGMAWLGVSAVAFIALVIRGRSLRRAAYYLVEWVVQGGCLVPGLLMIQRSPASFRWEGEEEVPAAKQSEKLPRVLLIGPRPEPPFLGGVEKGVDLLLGSDLAARTSMRVFDTYRVHDPHRSLAERIAYMYGRIRALRRDLADHPVDLVHVKTSSGVNFHQNALYAWTARRQGLPVVLQIHSGRFETFFRRSPALLRAWIRWTLRCTTRVVVLSRGWADRIAAIAPPARLSVVPNGLDDAEMALLRQSGDFRSPQVLFLGTGNAALNRDKGLEDLLHVLPGVARSHPETRWVLAGLDDPGAVRARLEAEGIAASGSGPRVRCLERVAGDERLALLSESTVLVLPSYFENMPNVLLEAMAAGLGVVATDVGAIPEMLGYGEGGLLVPPGNRSALAGALDRLLASPARVRTQARRNRETVVSQYSMRVMQERLEEVYRAAAGWPPSRRNPASGAVVAFDAESGPRPAVPFSGQPVAKP